MNLFVHERVFSRCFVSDNMYYVAFMAVYNGAAECFFLNHNEAQCTSASQYLRCPQNYMS